MANIKVTLDYQINDGMSLTFKWPCDCTEVTGLKIYYPILTDDTEASTYKLFTFKDAHGNDLASIGNLFTTGVYVKVILDTTNDYAYIQNADTNSYMENNLSTKSKKINSTITAAGWRSGKYTFSDSSITSTCVIELLPRENGGITKTQYESLAGAMIVGGAQATGSIELTALGDVPTIDIPVTVIVRSDL